MGNEQRRGEGRGDTKIGRYGEGRGDMGNEQRRGEGRGDTKNGRYGEDRGDMRNEQRRGEGRGDTKNGRYGEGRGDMRNEQRRGEGRGDMKNGRYGENRAERNMRGAARRTYPVAEDGQADFYRGNGGRSARGAGPRVGAVYANVPAARRVDAQDDFRPAREGRFESGGAVGRDLPAPRERPAADKVEENENLLVGRNPIREALKSGRPVEKLLVAQGDLSGAARDIIRMAREAGAVVQQVDRSRLDQIYPAHQGMLAYVAAVEYRTLDDAFECAARRGEDPFLVVLDGVTDPHNLGAIIRSAECAGVHGVIVPERRAAGLGPAAAKAAAGALNYMRIVRVKNLNRTIEELKARGVWVIGTAMDGEDALRADLTGPMALVIGSEGEGISRLTLEKCDRTLTLPMKGSIESLNASVAAGVLMYEVVRARAK